MRSILFVKRIVYALKEDILCDELLGVRLLNSNFMKAYICNYEYSY